MAPKGGTNTLLNFNPNISSSSSKSSPASSLHSINGSKGNGHSGPPSSATSNAGDNLAVKPPGTTTPKPSPTDKNLRDLGFSKIIPASQHVITNLGRFHDIAAGNTPSLYKIDWAEAQHSKQPSGETSLVDVGPENATIILAALMIQLKKRNYDAKIVKGQNVLAITNGTLFEAETSGARAVCLVGVQWFDGNGQKYVSLLPLKPASPHLIKDFTAGQLENLAFVKEARQEGPLNTTLLPTISLTLRINPSQSSLQVRPRHDVSINNTVPLQDFLKMLLQDAELDNAKGNDWIRSLSPLFRGLKVQRTYEIFFLDNENRNNKPRASVIMGFGLPAAEQTFQSYDSDEQTPKLVTVQNFFNRQGNRCVQHPEQATVNVGRKDRPIWIPLEKLNVVADQVLPRKLVEFISTLNKNAQMQWSEWIGAENLVNSPNDIKFNLTSALIPQVKTHLDTLVSTTPTDLISTKLNAPRHIDPDHIDHLRGSWLLGSNIPTKLGTFEISPAVFWVGEKPNVPDKKVHDALSLLFDSFNTRFGLKTNGYKSHGKNSQLPPHLNIDSIVDDMQAAYPGRHWHTPSLILTYKLTRDDHAKLRRTLDAAGIRAVLFDLHEGGPGKGKPNFINTSPEKFAIHFPNRELALKMNALTNTGRNFRIKVPTNLSPYTMLIGATLTKPGSNASKDCPAVASLVASSDQYWDHLPGTMRTQSSAKGKHEIESMYSMMVETLRRWKETNMKLPTSILLYRSGTSEIEYRKVLDREMDAIKRAYASLAAGSDRPIQITIILVEKNHKARFAPATGETDRLDHGAVVDIPQLDTNGCRQFYLQSFSNIDVGQPKEKETKQVVKAARNTHYFIIKNELNLSVDAIKELTYSLCWIAPHSSSVLTYVAPIALAEKLAKRGRTYLSEVWNGKSRITVIPTKLWRVQQQGRSVPWHRDLDRVMFYL